MNTLFSPIAHPEVYLPHFGSSDNGRSIYFYMIGTYTTDESSLLYKTRVDVADVLPIAWIYTALNTRDSYNDVFASTSYKLTFYTPGQNPWNTSETNNSWKLEQIGYNGDLSSINLESTTDTLFVKSVNYSMTLWCSFNQALYTNGREFSIKDMNGQMGTSQLIMQCNITNTIENDSYFKTALTDKKYVYFGNGYTNNGNFWLLP